MFFTASPTVPWLLKVVNTSKIMCAYGEEKGTWKVRNAILILILLQKKILPTVLKPNWCVPTNQNKVENDLTLMPFGLKEYTAFRRITCLIRRGITFTAIYFLFKSRIIDLIFEKNLRDHLIQFPQLKMGELKSRGVKWLSKLNTAIQYPKKSNLKWDINILALVQVTPNNFITFCQILLRKTAL